MNPLFDVSFPVETHLRATEIPETAFIAGLMKKAEKATELGDWLKVEVYASAAYHIAKSCNGGPWFETAAREAQRAVAWAQAQGRPVHKS